MGKQSRCKANRELPSLDSEHGHQTKLDPRNVGNQPANISLPDSSLTQGASLHKEPSRPDPLLPLEKATTTNLTYANHEETSGQKTFACS